MYVVDIMHPATLHGVVGVISKLYFAIFAAFKESMTLNLAQRSIESQCTTLYRPLIVAFALSSNVSAILPALYTRANCVL